MITPKSRDPILMKFSYERDDTYVIILCLYLRQSFEIFLQFNVLSILITTYIREFYHERDSSKRENISFKSVCNSIF